LNAKKQQQRRQNENAVLRAAQGKADNFRGHAQAHRKAVP
jgi:hypothetical protein